MVKQKFIRTGKKERPGFLELHQKNGGGGGNWAVRQAKNREREDSSFKSAIFQKIHRLTLSHPKSTLECMGDGRG